METGEPREAIAGNLWLGTAETFVLVSEWHSCLDEIFHLHSERVWELWSWVIMQASEDVFVTMPIEQQTELVNRGVPAVFSPSSVVAVLKKKLVRLKTRNKM